MSDEVERARRMAIDELRADLAEAVRLLREHLRGYSPLAYGGGETQHGEDLQRFLARMNGERGL